MWTVLPDLNALLTPVLIWATAAVATIAAIILVWSIYENWTRASSAGTTCLRNARPCCPGMLALQ